MAKLNIAERRLPQDGRIQLKVLGKEIDLRVSTLPTLYGESLVMRILDKSDASGFELKRLGFPGRHPGLHGEADRPALRHPAGDRPHRKRASPPPSTAP